MNNGRFIASFVFVIVVVTALAGEDANDLSAEKLVEKVVQDSRGDGFLEREVLVGRVDILPMLLERMKPESPVTKRRLVRMTMQIARKAKPEQARWCYSQPAARFLASVLVQETNPDVRAKEAETVS